MIATSRNILIGLALLVAPGSVEAASRTARPAAASEIARQQMIFFVAKGAPDSCGPGCSEWIAAEGAFDRDAHQRLREFLASQNRKDMPIFFHSGGGIIGSSVLVGRILRERRMTAGVGQTLPEGCRYAPIADEACRKLMRSGREMKARLLFSGARCASGCAYALLGASIRIIAADARVGVHATQMIPRPGPAGSSRVPGAPSKPDYDRLRRYAIEMGIDAGLIDLARQTGSKGMYWLSRRDLARFGILADGLFETGWQLFDAPGTSAAIAKSVTERSPVANQGLLTTTIELGCAASGNVSFSVRRELPNDSEAPRFRVTAGVELILDDDERTGASWKLNHRAKFLSGETIRRAAASDSIVLQETTGAKRQTRFSTKGLSETLTAAHGACAGKS